MRKTFDKQVNSANILRNVLVFFFLSGYLGLSVYFKLFVIQDVSCQIPDGQCSEAVLAELNRLHGQFFFSPNIQKTVEKILQNDPDVSEIHLDKKFPHSIVFSLQKKELLAEMHCDTKALQINVDGKVEESIKELTADHSIIHSNDLFCDSLLKQGSVAPDRISELTAFQQKLTQHDANLTLSWQDTDTVVLLTPTNQKIVLRADQLDRSLEMYHYLLDQKQLEVKWIELDLRFQKAIVKTSAVVS